jgi:MFS family permease
MKFRYLLLKEESSISFGQLSAISILIAFTLAWFLLLQIYFVDVLEGILGESIWVCINILLFYGFGALSAIIGTRFTDIVQQKKLLAFWIVLGSLATATWTISQGLIISIFLSILLGFSLGLGFPSIQSFLANSTEWTDRARVAGITILASLIVMFFSIFLIAFMVLDLSQIFLLLALLRMLSIFGLFIGKSKKSSTKQASWSWLLHNRDFLNYIFPWLMFNVASGIRQWWNVSQIGQSLLVFGSILFLICAAFLAYVSGVIADYKGRKYSIVIGMLLMGVSYTILGVKLSPIILLTFSVLSGAAWGFILPLYITVPGDLAKKHERSSEKFYALGTGIPFILFLLFSTLPELYPFNVSPEGLAPFLSIIIFISTIPVVFAEETLPRKLLEKRRWKKHIDELGKLKQDPQYT